MACGGERPSTPSKTISFTLLVTEDHCYLLFIGYLSRYVIEDDVNYSFSRMFLINMDFFFLIIDFFFVITKCFLHKLNEDWIRLNYVIFIH